MVTFKVHKDLGVLGTVQLKAKRLVQPKNSYENKDIELWKLYKEGDQKAKWELLERFNGLIGNHASKYSNVLPRPVVESQLKQLTLKAFDTYKPNMNTKLSTHVVNSWKKLSRANMANQQAIRLPENIALKFKVYNDGQNYLTDILNREPTTVELADHLGWGTNDVANLSKRFHRELVESKQVYDPGVTDQDASHQALLSTYYTVSEPERYFMEHTLGKDFMGKKEKSSTQIQKDLKLNTYQYYKLKNGVIDKLQKSIGAFDSEN